MIVPLDVSQREVAEQILAVQIPAYQVEAEWIGFQGIPHLHETITSLMQSNLTFYGYRKDGCIAGVIAYEKKQRVLEIDRLVVHPQYFRQGIGQCLIQFVLDNETDVDKYT
ncbi:GNAT family N-acetyltransferase [Thermoflavimicrobium dichotomicum]|uniref:Acetyltransferase (GNAT) domain-containing protein n=1 Tax=Thermoflavimicrobium dichotomicum TaxID=46223 RepID=A0A1I3RZK2_9BACL|nr:GNAT family N-acetyltransferase [Thermoflavimicrobium dichotomicum]SFJ51362.1 Acetyltransferase (GNAT) domain-containing protein [Thermoflavimicrobium dichotomicum]